MRISDWSSDVCSSDLPRLAIFAAAAQVRDREYAALVDPGEPRRREGGGHRHVEAAIAIEKRRRSLGSVKAFLHHDEHRHLGAVLRSEEHTSELQSLMRISYAAFCLKKKNN